MSFGASVFLLLVPLVYALDPAVAHAAVSTDFAGLVDIGGGRKIYMECRGSGSPTVVLISGKGNGAADWNELLDPADPMHEAPYDMVGTGKGEVHRSESAVLPSVSSCTRVCTYDRPGTRIDGKDISTPIPQPHPVDHALDDLHKLLAASGEPGPYVLVAHSYGGLIAELYARTYPGDVVGLVMVDTATELMLAAGCQDLSALKTTVGSSGSGGAASIFSKASASSTASGAAGKDILLFLSHPSNASGLATCCSTRNVKQQIVRR